MENKETNTANGVLWLNGETTDFQTARVALEDRGFQFGDGIYEVARVYGGAPFMLTEHIERLFRSAHGIELQLPMTRKELFAITRDLLARAALSEAEIYIQITRGATSPRNPLWTDDIKPTVIVGVRPLRYVPPELRAKGCKVITLPDERWARCDLKTICLLPNVLAKKQAQRNSTLR